MTDLPDDIARALAACAAPQRERLEDLRRLILDVAEETPGIGPLTETLKWGEPAYLTEQSRSGSTLRIGPVKHRPDRVALFVNCRTRLADTFRERFGPKLDIDGDRAVLVDVHHPPEEAVLRECIALTLTYHRWRSAA